MGLAGAVLRGSGKVCVGVVDAALVCSAVGALRRKKMRGVVKRSVKSAMEAVGNMVNNIIRGLDEEKKSLGEILVCCFIVLPVMSPVFLVVGNMAFLFELGAGTLTVAGPPGAVAFAGMKYLRTKDRHKPKVDTAMLLMRLVGFAAPCSVLFDGKKMGKLLDEVSEEIREEEREARRVAREKELRELRAETSSAAGDGDDAPAEAPA
jgi:hypothetical protein